MKWILHGGPTSNGTGGVRVVAVITLFALIQFGIILPVLYELPSVYSTYTIIPQQTFPRRRKRVKMSQLALKCLLGSNYIRLLHLYNVYTVKCTVYIGVHQV